MNLVLDLLKEPGNIENIPQKGNTHKEHKNNFKQYRVIHGWVVFLAGKCMNLFQSHLSGL